MHVLMISDVYFPRINGVSTSIETFRRDLVDQGIEISLVAPDYPEPHSTPATWRIPSRRLPFDPEDRLMRWRPLMQAVEDISRHKVDLIHVQTPFAAHYAGLSAARSLKAPILATYHTHFEEYIGHYLPLFPRPLLRHAARGLARRQCNGLDAVVVPSLAMHQTLAGYGVTTPLHVLPTGIPIEQFSAGHGPRFRHRHGIPEGRPMALYVGRVAHEKNIVFLIDAIKLARRQHPDLLLVIAGDGPALPALQRMVVGLELEDHVQFVGYLDRQQELPDCYAAADLFVFSSRTETQGLVLLEAMAAGLPVYAFAALGTRDIVEPQQGAVAAPEELAAFAAGLTELLADRPRLAHLSVAARQFAQSWSAPDRARQLAGLYRSLCR
ncbi:glycosyltransferase [Denitratisoma oestradiolicum]|uniref:Glycosyl transferase family 1 n=1 Tax=Denitratisoma oestradiolicum TaxID=311182 RepID=A0A6S6XXA5_9PROT|nr:glycosyltransferase [Denitratisoma oestradiolicum]CAB1368737.1 Glycosyl transferase family 1 [Denitratisoma oestradiolicum]